MSTIKGYVIRNDIRLFLLFNKDIQNKILDRLMLILTRCFDTSVVFAFAIGAYILSTVTGHPFGYKLAVLLCVSEGITHLIKVVVSRSRPFVSLSEALFEFVPPKDMYSFPSGHTCAAFTYAVVFSMFFPGLKLVWMGIATLVGISRVYLGYHYPTDVIIGACIPVIMKGLLISAGWL